MISALAEVQQVLRPAALERPGLDVVEPHSYTRADPEGTR